MEKNMNKTRRIPFDVNKAKAGAKIITRNKRPVRILDYNLKSLDTPIVAAVMEDTYEHVFKYKINGKHWCKDLYEFDLFIEEDVKTRQMTNQELADWLRDAPKEYRELRYAGDKDVYSTYDYPETEANTPVEKNRLLIRRNHGEWQEPLIEVE